jgi:hypothetical protein
MLDNVFTESVVRCIALDFRGLGRLESHVVPAEILKAVTDLAETLRPHGRTSCALTSEKTR